MAVEQSSDPLTYGSYLRVPELTAVQSPLADPPVRDEMLFVIGQQAQELWFKQILFDLQYVIARIGGRDFLSAARLLERINRILRILGDEAEVLELLEPSQFQQFRGVLKAASGLESEQFRELEIASGLREPTYLRMAGKLLDLPAVLSRWPTSLHDALLSAFASSECDAVEELVLLYQNPEADPSRYQLAEACSEYDIRFQAWRFHHLQLVERVIGDLSPGTGGSAGSAYLARTLNYRFIPELWEARNRLTARSTRAR